MDQVKKCTKCGEVKPLDYFNRNRCAKDGLRFSCVACDFLTVAHRKSNPEKYKERDEILRIKKNAHYAANREQIAKIRKSKYAIWRNANPVKVRETPTAESSKAKKREWSKANADKVRASQNKYRKSHLDAKNKASAEWRNANRERCAVSGKAWSAAHPENKRLASKKSIDALSDCYVSAKLRRGTPLKRIDIPPELIEAKRVHLQLKRKLKELKV